MTVMEPTAIPPGSVVVTPSQMYDEMRSIAKSVDHLAAIIDPALAELRVDVADNRSEIKAHDVRLRSVERRVWAIPSAALLVSIAGVVVALVAIL